MTREEIRLQVAISALQGVLEAKFGVVGEALPSVAVEESLRIADEFVKQWFGDEEVKNIEQEKEQKPAEWSEEDKDIINEVASILINDENRAENKEEENRLAYLSEKIQYLILQPHWKRSEEQMEALKLTVSNKKHYAPVLHEIALDTLYNDLKKL